VHTEIRAKIIEINIFLKKMAASNKALDSAGRFQHVHLVPLVSNLVNKSKLPMIEIKKFLGDPKEVSANKVD